MVIVKCAHCNTEFEKGHRLKFCSSECCRKHHNAINNKYFGMAVCEGCGISYQKHNASQRFCSNPCANRTRGFASGKSMLGQSKCTELSKSEEKEYLEQVIATRIELGKQQLKLAKGDVARIKQIYNITFIERSYSWVR